MSGQLMLKKLDKSDKGFEKIQRVAFGYKPMFVYGGYLRDYPYIRMFALVVNELRKNYPYVIRIV